MAHRRQYLPDGRTTHYDLLKWRSHAEKWAKFQTTQVVKLIHAAKSSLPGTVSHRVINEQLVAYAKQLGFFRGTKLRLEVALARLWAWITRTQMKRYAAFQKEAA